MRGKFITFEGSEGSGKSTQIKLLYKYLKSKRKRVIHLREPGAARISESIRAILLDVKNKRMTRICETLLYMAARAQLVDEVIIPELKKGTIVLCDRFLDSTVAYQGFGMGVDVRFIKSVGKAATQGITPDLTFVFDLPAREGLSRRKRSKDRIEHRPLRYHDRVHRGYLKIARREPNRVKIVKAQLSRQEIQKTIRRFVGHLLKI